MAVRYECDARFYDNSGYSATIGDGPLAPRRLDFVSNGLELY